MLSDAISLHYHFYFVGSPNKTGILHWPFKDEEQTALFKDPVHTLQ
jgi:hypothetical protein